MSATISEDEIRLAHIITHPARFKIVRLLTENPKMYIAQIGEDLHMDRKVVSFHLKILERDGLVETKLDTKVPRAGNPVLVRYAWLTEKAKVIERKCGL